MRDMNPRCHACGETIWLHPEMDFGNEKPIECERFVPQCPKCLVPLQPGIAMRSTSVVGSHDFGPDDEIVTVSVGGPGKIVDAMKCPKCGWSVTK